MLSSQPSDEETRAGNRGTLTLIMSSHIFIASPSFFSSFHNAYLGTHIVQQHAGLFKNVKKGKIKLLARPGKLDSRRK